MRIELANYKDVDINVFSGRKRGRALRKALKLDDQDKGNESVIFVIPEDTLSLNPSFFLGLLGKSVRALGIGKFENKYTFLNDENHRENIEEGKRRALNESDVLDERDDD